MDDSFYVLFYTVLCKPADKQTDKRSHDLLGIGNKPAVDNFCAVPVMFVVCSDLVRLDCIQESETEMVLPLTDI